MSQAKHIEIKDVGFGGDLGSKDLRLSASGNQLVVVTITKDEAFRIATALIEAARTWDET